MRVWRSLSEADCPGAVVTLGFFDGVHLGHQHLLQQLRNRANRANAQAVAITLWPHPRIVLGNQPERLRLIHSLDEKTRRLSQFGIDALLIIDFTLEVAALSAEAFLDNIFRHIKPQAFVIGYDHHFGSHGSGDYHLLARYAQLHAFEAVRVEAFYHQGLEVSSTLVRKCIAEADLRSAAELMGQTFGFKALVQSGKGLGRTIGCPTANLYPDSAWQLLPPHGVYFGRCILENGTPYDAVINVGTRPTVDSDGETSVEAHLLGFKGNLYGKRLRVEFTLKHRDELRFSGLEELQQAIQADIDAMHEWKRQS